MKLVYSGRHLVFRRKRALSFLAEMGVKFKLLGDDMRKSVIRKKALPSSLDVDNRLPLLVPGKKREQIKERKGDADRVTYKPLYRSSWRSGGSHPP